MEANYKGIKFSDDDVVNLDDCIWKGEYNPHNVRPWLLHDHGFILAIVFADCLQDALDEAVDNDKLDSFQVTEEDLKDYDEDSLAHLGNAGEPFDLEGVGAFELPTPTLSFCGLFQLEE